MKSKGFTLIELLIALIIITILAGLSTSALYHAFKTSDRLKVESQKLEALELSIILMQRDFSEAITRSIIGPEMHIFPIFSGTSQTLEFTRTGIINPAAFEKRSHLLRIAYLCQGSKLIRRTWAVLDSIDRHAYEDKILLNNLKLCQFAYLSKALQSLNEWRANAVSQSQASESLPQAVQLTIILNNSKKFSLLFPIQKALYRGEK